jgi:hypothetical protein
LIIVRSTEEGKSIGFSAITTSPEKEVNQGGKGETPGVSTPLEKKYQWSTTGVEWSIGGVGSE